MILSNQINQVAIIMVTSNTMFLRTTYSNFSKLITKHYIEKAHCFVITDSALKRKKKYYYNNIKFTFSQIFRTLKYMTTGTEPAFLCVFRSSGDNSTEIMQKSIYVRVEFAKYSKYY